MHECGGKLMLLLFKQCLDNLLFLLHVFLAFFKSVAFSLDINGGAVMPRPAQDGGCYGNICENLIPL